MADPARERTFSPQSKQLANSDKKRANNAYDKKTTRVHNILRISQDASIPEYAYKTFKIENPKYHANSARS